MGSLLSQQELINTNSWTIDLREPYVPLKIKDSKLKRYYNQMKAWKEYQLILKGNS
jgi:hypothetical protein